MIPSLFLIVYLTANICQCLATSTRAQLLNAEARRFCISSLRLCALPLPLGELAQEVLVGAAQDIGLDVAQAQPVLAEHLYQFPQPVIPHHALPRLRGVEIHRVNHPRQFGVLARDGAHRVGERLAQPGGQFGQVAPAGGRRQVEAHQVVVVLDQPLGGRAAAELVAQAGDLVVEDVGQALEEDEGQDVVLELGCIHRSADLAGGFPQPGLEGGDVQGMVVRGHTGWVLLSEQNGQRSRRGSILLSLWCANPWTSGARVDAA